MNVVTGYELPPKRHDGDAAGRYNLTEIEPLGAVIHYFSARYTKPEDPYDLNACLAIFDDYKISYHDLFARSGTRVQLVPVPYKAWHAGVSSWDGRKWCNGFMFGLAYLSLHEDSPTDGQLDGLAERIGELVTAYPTMREDYIVGHQHVSPRRKKDPGPNFPWDRFRQSIAGFWRP